MILTGEDDELAFPIKVFPLDWNLNPFSGHLGTTIRRIIQSVESQA